MPNRRIPREIRFWSKVDKSAGDAGCWLWRSSRRSSGHGTFVERKGGPTKATGAHRVAYEYLVGPIPDGLVLDHLCRNPPCVNPAHLEPVTQHENSRRAAEQDGRGSYKTECPHGHPYSVENTRVYTDPSGQVRRNCRTCGNAAQREYQAKLRVGREPRPIDYVALGKRWSEIKRAKYAAMTKPTCAEPGCDREAKSYKSWHGLCSMHEQRMYKARRAA